MAVLVKQQYLHTFSQYGERRPTNGWDRFGSLGHPSNFQRVSRLGFFTAPTSLIGCQPNFAWCLAVSLAATLYIHLGVLPLTEFCQLQKITLRPSLALSYIGSLTARHSSSGRPPDFAALYLTILTQKGGHPVWHWAVELSSLAN